MTMRFWLVAFGLLISSALLQVFLPWWSLVIIAMVWGYSAPLFPRNRSFWAGFTSGFLLWGGYALYLSLANEGLLAGRIGQLLGGIPGGWLPLVSGVFAGVLSGMGALTGRMGKDLLAGVK